MAFLIRFEDGSYNSGAGDKNGFPCLKHEATRYETRELAEAKLVDLDDAVIEEEPDDIEAWPDAVMLQCQPVTLLPGGEGTIQLSSFLLSRFAGDEVDVLIKKRG